MNKFKTFLEELDNNIVPIESYYEVSSKIREFTKNEIEINDEIKKEQMLFDFVEDYSWDESKEDFFNWGTYYGPMYILPSQDDENIMNVYPHINKIDQGVINYFLKRADESSNPILIARYISVSVDFSNKLGLKNVDYRFIVKYLDCVIYIFENGLIKEKYYLVRELMRAVFFAKTYNNKEYFHKLKDIIIRYEDQQCNENMGLWGISFDLFVNDNKGLQIDVKEKNQIISNIINRIEIEEKKELPNIFIIEKALPVLKKTKEISGESFNNFFSKLVSIYNKNIEKDKDPLLKVNHLKGLLELYQEYNLKDYADEVIKKINGVDLTKGLKTFSFSTNFTEDEINDYIKGFFGENNSYDLQKIMWLISKNFIVSRNKTQKEFEENQRKYPLNSIFSTYIIDSEGGLVGTLSGLNEPEKQLIHEASQSIGFGNVFLKIIFDYFIENIRKEDFYNYLMDTCDILKGENEMEIKELVDNLYNKNSYSLVGILIPLIESLFRKIVHLNGGNVKKEDERNGGFMNKTLGEILNDKILIDLFTESFMFYFKVVLSERLGLNLRNDFCHGINKEKFFDYHVVLRVVHIFIVLVTFIKIKK
nr:DUF4209 domain-containing protein [Candidatus Gracilibacteria bacterium]